MHAMRRLAHALFVGALLTMVMAVSADAQSLGRLGRAVKAGIGNAAQEQATATTPAAARTAAGTARFTAEQLDAFAAGLALEVERRSGLAAELRALEPRPDHDNCRLQFAMSDAGQRAMEEFNQVAMVYYADPQNEAKRDAMQRSQQKLEVEIRGACGPSPDEAERLRRERQAEPARAGAERAGTDAAAYALLKELTYPFCAAADRLEAGRDAQIPSGAGRNYTYSADDTALLMPRCPRLLPLLQATL